MHVVNQSASYWKNNFLVHSASLIMPLGTILQHLRRLSQGSLGFVLLFAIALSAPNSWAASKDTSTLQIDVAQMGDQFVIDSTIPTNLDACAAFAYMNSHEMAAAMPEVIEQKITQVDEHTQIIKRVARESILFIPYQIKSVIEYHISAPNRIDFKQTEGDLKTYSGFWEIEKQAKGSVWHYHGNINPDSWIPNAVIQYFIEYRLKKKFVATLEHVQQNQAKIEERFSKNCAH